MWDPVGRATRAGREVGDGRTQEERAASERRRDRSECHLLRRSGMDINVLAGSMPLDVGVHGPVPICKLMAVDGALGETLRGQSRERCA